MSDTYEIRADYDKETITVYQAYPDAIAKAAVARGTFAAPFSLQRMTWIKPSFLWMMERCNWGRKSNQENVLAVRIKRTGWEDALSQGVLTHPEPGVYRDPDDWKRQMDAAAVNVQWDPERSLRGESLDIRSIQVGLSRHIIQRYVSEWIVEIKDMTPLVRKMHALIQSGESSKAKALLPKERVYPVSSAIAKRLGMRIG